MGLDMFAAKVHAKVIGDAQVDFAVTQEATAGIDPEIHYWRKHPDLHGWMQRLYVEKGGKSSCPGDINCVNLRITEADLAVLERDLKTAGLPETSGFFFGQSTPDRIESDLIFVDKARRALAEGYAVVYSSWW